MHTFIGGAYNGKHEYVRRWLKERGIEDVEWYVGQLPKTPTSHTVVVSKLEEVIKPFLEEDEVTLAIQIVEQLQLLEKQHQVIIIATEMGRGIVPIEQQDRQLRDTLGRLYQQLFAISDHVTRIWYGIAEEIK
ncbi:bifunctional adenosylcobinamide kinase/adenosylcobinamide-phosphate guanylyltransferase [uncultured Rummeliibacillus sp.]|mgnify:FL=1|uniref:bifunctional adenosylcobinamide kinase/adenosylcobinamide-phosphate guanylyltransferase n=1 Tax=uncultured Rummeliibacillus sp. TaxID=762292 RepID=UPI00261C3684|nr:bifunctional adenosylcobinamide kinase/adenosylcobinamide-phosphate guanylyltransferase [uncultured Rummeliibacillus sp.]